MKDLFNNDATGSQIGYSYPEYKGAEPQFTFDLGCNQKVEIKNSEGKTIATKLVVAGCIELTLKDFDNNFILKSLILGPNVRADIYYKVKEIEVNGNAIS